MAFHYDDRLRHQYWHDGYVVLRGIVPPALVRDLRRQIDIARDYVHREVNPQAQRLQPVVKYPELLDLQPFRDYHELPVLHDAITRLLGPDYRPGIWTTLGILVEPAEHSWCHGWHRDGLVEVPPEARDAIIRAADARRYHDPRMYNQVNCAIYADSCTWYVPGSHQRHFDMPGERYTTTPAEGRPEKPADMSDAEFEIICREHCLSFPGAVQMHLGPGDYMLYRNCAWHCGNYLRYQPRGTLHDTCTYVADRSDIGVDWTQEKRDAIARMHARQAAATGQAAAH